MSGSAGADSFLLAELKAGNSRAFDRIFRLYYENLCRFANSMVRDEDSAQSLVQHIFIKLWEDHAFLPEIERLSPYLTTMVRNHCLNYIQREKRNVRLPEIPAESQTGNTTEQDLTMKEIQEQLVVALHELPERCRQAFELSRFEHLSNKEIAEQMEISVKGVEALIGRALKTLRTSLIEYLPSSKENKIPSSLFFIFVQGLKKYRKN